MTPNDNCLKFGFYLLDGFSMLCLANAIEPLRAANIIGGTKLFSRTLYSSDGDSVVSSSGMAIQPDYSISQAEQMDYFFIISSYDYRHKMGKKMRIDIRKAAKKSLNLGGLDTGSWLLASAGLIDQRMVTIHWQELTIFAETFKRIKVSGQRYVIDGNTLTAGGATTTLDLMLNIIRHRYGKTLYFDVMNLFIYDGNSSSELQQNSLANIEYRLPRLGSAIQKMKNHIESPLRIEQIASAASISPRTLQRIFIHELGVSPGKYYLHLRLHSARRLIAETGLNITVISIRCGFSTPSSFSRAFRHKFGVSPKYFRRGRLQ